MDRRIRMAKIVLGVGILLTFDCASLSVNGYMRDFPGPYCAQRRGGCCDSRKDECSVPISTTLCYCDEFCDRTVNGDCCPDYESFCLNISPADDFSVRCKHKDTIFNPFEQIQDNCNLCTCQGNGHTVCEQNTCLIDDSLVHNVNTISHTLGWTAYNYSEFWGRKYQEGLNLRLGTKEPTYRVKAMTKLSSRPESLPKDFNAIDHWPGFISGIRDQGWCGSSWAVSTSSVASDRFAIQTKGKETVELAAQHLLSCVRKQSGCQGGHLDWAWNYIRKIGLVDDECYPYTAEATRCKIRRTDTLSSAGCKLPNKVPRDHLYRVGPAYSLNNESDIMAEIYESGPVQATMRVFRDFFTYRRGIYRHSAASRGEPSGFHSIRLIGWGEERSGYDVTKYWIAANSWGKWWGENGYFRILRGSNECEIENYVLATWPHAHLQPKTPSNRVSKPHRPFW